MSRSAVRWRAALPIALFVALLALAFVQWSVALFGVVWRTAVLSWDNPATQLVEEIASGVVPTTDPRRLTSERLAAAHARRRSIVADVAGRPRAPERAGDTTRAPHSA